MSHPSRFCAFACNGKRLDGRINSDDGAGRTDDLSRDPGHVAEPCAHVEHTPSRGHARRLQQHARRPLDDGGLPIEPRQFKGIVAEHVGLPRFSRFHVFFSHALREVRIRMSWLGKYYMRARHTRVLGFSLRRSRVLLHHQAT